MGKIREPAELLVQAKRRVGVLGPHVSQHPLISYCESGLVVLTSIPSSPIVLAGSIDLGCAGAWNWCLTHVAHLDAGESGVATCRNLCSSPLLVGYDDLAFLQNPFPLPNCHSTNVYLARITLYIRRHLRTRDSQWKALKGAKGAGKNPHRCRSIQSGTFYALHYSGRWPLRGHSFQEALRVFFQPIKHDDPRLDFYAIYKKEATEYDTDYVKKYDEDLNTTLIFVRHLENVLRDHLTLLIGGSVLCCQFCLRH